MRLIPVLLIAVALATAGCFGKDDENGGDTTTTPTPGGTTPTGTGTTTPTGATPTSPTGGGNSTTPPVAARELCPVSFSFDQNIQPPAGPAPPTQLTTGTCGTVTAGYRTITLFGNFTVAEPIVATSGVSVAVTDANGAALLTCAGPSAPGPAPAPVVCEQTGTATVGDYGLAFSGTGNVDFAGTVIIS